MGVLSDVSQPVRCSVADVVTSRLCASSVRLNGDLVAAIGDGALHKTTSPDDHCQSKDHIPAPPRHCPAMLGHWWLHLVLVLQYSSRLSRTTVQLVGVYDTPRVGGLCMVNPEAVQHRAVPMEGVRPSYLLRILAALTPNTRSARLSRMSCNSANRAS